MGRHRISSARRFSTASPPTGTRRRVPGRRIRGGVLAVVTALAACLLVTTSTGATAARIPTADNGAKVVGQRQVHRWMRDIRINSPSLGGSAPVRLLLPRKWYSQPRRNWPVLYLMHGCCSDADNKVWTKYTDAARFFANKDVLVVLPGNGRAGYYSEHWNYGAANTRPNAEYFHTRELVQILRRGYRADTTRMAVAGLSFAGYGAMEYAARHPNLFKSAAAYSGFFLDTQFPGVAELIYQMRERNGHDPHSLWGHWALNEDVWRKHNPAARAEQLRGVNLYVSSGTGVPGEHDNVTLDGLLNHTEGAVIGTTMESAIFASTLSFVTRLRLHGIPVTTDFGSGMHNWPYWQQALHNSWPVLAKGLRLPH